ncbi:MAG: VCBS repeat-containing protein [Proteobacteria bacterium]|nr:VCBS repeat-containing protein [Pseudomonadota bacterium]
MDDTNRTAMPAAAPSPARSRRPGRWLLLGLPALLAGCYHNDSSSYSLPPPVEVSYGVVAGDFNHDGLPDVVQLSTVQPIYAYGTSAFKTYLGSGSGPFLAPVATAAGTDPLFAVAADVNGDGALDVVTASYDDGAIGVFFNNAATPGTFNVPLSLPSAGASQVAVADMTGDGLPDIVAADFNVSLFVQTAPGLFASPVALYSGGANWVALGDLNHDGIPDVALTDATGVKVLLHTGAAGTTTYAAPVGVFTQTANANLSGANVVAIGDVEGDGYNDLVITDPGPTGGAAPTVNVLRQNAMTPGTFLPAESYPIVTNDISASIQLVDLTGAGALDIVIGAYNHVTVLLHDPANPGKFLPATVYAAPGAYEIAIADVNGDGRPDIVVANGVSHPVVSGTTTTKPGVLLQSATAAGSFAALADLP